MNKTRIYKYWCYVLVLTVLTGCRKDLCYDHSKEVDLHLEVTYSLDWHLPWDENWYDNWPAEWTVDWDRMLPRLPEGVRLHVFDYHDKNPISSHNLEHHGGRVAINGGRYDMLLYNNDTEGIMFENMNAVNEAIATTRTRTRSVHYSNKYPGDVTAGVPDMLFAAYLPEKELAKRVDGETAYTKMKVEMTPRTWTYLIRYEFTSGLEYVAEAQAYLSGMAGGVSLKDGRTIDSKVVTLLLDCDKRDYGVETIARSFGRPATATAHRLVLELKLMSGKVKMVEFDVSDQVRRQPQGGVIVVDGITVTKEEGEKPDNGSGFDGDVNDWDENEDVDVPIS